jgi:subtilase family serine protease
MNCRNCGKLVNPKDRNCVYCGTRLSKGMPTWGKWLTGVSLTGVAAILVIVLVLPNISPNPIEDVNNSQNNDTPPTVLMPDLVIQDITWSPTNPSMGNDVTFIVTITNIGKSNSLPSHVAYYIDGAFKDSISVNSMDPGATGKVSFEWEAELGTHTIKTVADFNDSVSESDETNNEKEISFSGILTVDLIIQDITLTPASPSVGDVVVVTVTVKNHDNGAAGQFSLYFYTNGFLCSEYVIDSLYAGQTTTAIYEYSTTSGGFQDLCGGPLRPGSFIFKAVADGDNSVDESDETNNSKAVTFSVSK